MRIRVSHPGAGYQIKELRAAVSDGLAVVGYDQGQLEDMDQTIDKLRDAFGRMIEQLVTAGALDLLAVQKIMNSGWKLEAAPAEGARP